VRRTAAPGERCSAHGYAADDLGYARYDHGYGADLLDTVHARSLDLLMGVPQRVGSGVLFQGRMLLHARRSPTGTA
jgi:hypothetical protein